MLRRVRLELAFLVAACSLFGCAPYATWHDFVRSPNYRAPSSISIAVSRSNTVQAADEAGFVDATVRAVQNELRGRGVEGVVRASSDGAPAPRLELEFVCWQPGRGPVTHLTESVREEAFIAILVKALTNDDRLLLEGRVDGADLAAREGTRDVAEAAGRSIARAVADAEYKPKSPKSLATSLP
jgi:hypothetical protein